MLRPALGVALAVALLAPLPTALAWEFDGCFKAQSPRGPVGACVNSGNWHAQVSSPNCEPVWSYGDPDSFSSNTMYECTGPEIYDGKVCVTRWYSYGYTVLHVALVPGGWIISRSCLP